MPVATSNGTLAPPDPSAVAALLAAPFDPAEVKFKPQAVSGNRALAIPYVDARVIQDRLDDVLGVMGWQDSYECLPDGSVICRLRVRLGGEWITKEDVGGQSEQPDEGDRRKAAFSDALKRCAVKFGVGRYLYRTKPQWVDYDPQKRQFLKRPSLQPAGTSAGGAGDLPQPAAGVARPQAPTGPPSKPPSGTIPTTGAGLLEKLRRHDARLTGEGLCKGGDLLSHVIASGVRAGHGPEVTAWPASRVTLAIAEARAFEALLRGQ